MNTKRIVGGLAILVLPLASTGCIVAGQWGSRVWTETQSNRIPIQADGLAQVTVKTHNGRIRYAGEPVPASAYVDVSKRAGGRTPADAAEALAALDVYVERHGGQLDIGWRWNRPREPYWNAHVCFDIHAPSDVEISAEAHNGHVVVSDVTGPVRATTHNGPVEVDSRGGPLYVETHNGRIQARYTGDDVTLQTHNGTISAELGGAAVNGVIATHNGGVTLSVDPAVSARLQCRTHNGSIACTLPLRDVETSRHRLRGVLGEGDGRLEVTTHNGSVQLRRAG